MSKLTLVQLKNSDFLELKLHRVAITTRTDTTCTIMGKDVFHPQCIVYVRNVPWEGLLEWINGMSIQRALPGLSSDDREFLLNGTGAPTWDKLNELDKRINNGEAGDERDERPTFVTDDEDLVVVTPKDPHSMTQKELEAEMREEAAWRKP